MSGEKVEWKGEAFRSFLSKLREIGWAEWDPIGLSSFRAETEDEYDSYLLTVAGKISNSVPEDRIAAYLVRIETVHMGMQGSETAQIRAEKTVRKIAALLAD